MKLLRYREGNSIKPGILDINGTIKDISLIVNDWTGESINEETFHRKDRFSLVSNW